MDAPRLQPLDLTGRGRPAPPLLRVMLLACTLASTAIACGSGSGADPDQPLVVATTTQLADFARQIGGDQIEVRSLMRPNVDAHDFEPAPADLDALARAEVILANGVGLEPWLAAAVEASGTDTTVTDTSIGVEILDGAPGGHDHEHEDEAGSDHEVDADSDRDHDGGVNPHIWLDPQNARVMATNVATALVAALPDHAEAIEERAGAYDADLVALDEEIGLMLSDLDTPRIVTDHDAFGYFAAHYDIEVVGSIVTSFDSSAEVSAGDLKDLADAIAESDVGAVFTEQSMPPDSAEALARLVDVEVVSGENGLYTDSLGAEGSPGDTYVGMMRHNATTLERHLR